MTKARALALYTSLFLSMIQAAIAILGASEVLAAAGLCSFYQSYVAAEAISLLQRSPNEPVRPPAADGVLLRRCAGRTRQGGSHVG